MGKRVPMKLNFVLVSQKGLPSKVLKGVVVHYLFAVKLCGGVIAI